MQLRMRCILLHQPHSTDIGCYYAVGTLTVKHRQKIGQTRHFLIVRQCIAGDKHLHAVRMCIFYAFFKIVLAEIGGCGTHAELLAGKINRICAKIDRRMQPFKVARRAEQFAFVPFNIGHAHLPSLFSLLMVF